MKLIVKRACDFFDAKGMKYTVLNDENGVIEVIYSGKNMMRIRVVLDFDEDEILSNFYNTCGFPSEWGMLQKALITMR